jgi:hemolysin activation/secretion protein
MRSFCPWGAEEVRFAAKFFAALVIGGMSSTAFAQVIPSSEMPGREQQRFEQPPPVLARPAGPTISLPSTAAPAGAASTFVSIRSVRIVGSTVYGEAQLAPLYQDLIGQTVSLQVVYELARKITAKYGADGYVLSRAIVPPQNLNLKRADITIQVVEGYVDSVEWPKALSRYRDFFTSYAAKITSERPANIHTIERYMLLASDLPGLKFSTTLRASKDNTGASTLVVQVEEKPIAAQAQIDNRGTKARGPPEFLGSVTANNLLGLHESFSLSYAGAFPLSTLQYVSGGYRQVLTSEGFAFFLDANHSWGRPGTAPLEALQYATASTNFDAGLSYPIIRQREENLTISGLAFAEDDDADTLGAPFNRDRLRGVRVKLDGDLADAWQGINQLNVTLSQGINGLGSTDNGNLLASRLVGRVDFTKLEATLSRTQPLFDRFSAYGSLYGQYAFTPLLTPEQCGYGGQYFGRAFDPSELIADSCFEALAELRYDLPRPFAQVTKAQLYGFADYGDLFTRDTSVGTAANVGAASVGSGLRLGAFDTLNVDLQAAKGVEGPRDDWRFFFVVSARY